jgi:hypothetical protein
MSLNRNLMSDGQRRQSDQEEAAIERDRMLAEIDMLSGERLELRGALREVTMATNIHHAVAIAAKALK